MSLFHRMGQGTQQNQMQSIKNNPIEAGRNAGYQIPDFIGMGRNAGYKIPDGIGNNPPVIFQHLIQTGQITNPMMQRILPMMQRMGLK